MYTVTSAVAILVIFTLSSVASYYRQQARKINMENTIRVRNMNEQLEVINTLIRQNHDLEMTVALENERNRKRCDSDNDNTDDDEETYVSM